MRRGFWEVYDNDRWVSRWERVKSVGFKVGDFGFRFVLVNLLEVCFWLGFFIVLGLGWMWFLERFFLVVKCYDFMIWKELYFLVFFGSMGNGFLVELGCNLI